MHCIEMKGHKGFEILIQQSIYSVHVHISYVIVISINSFTAETSAEIFSTANFNNFGRRDKINGTVMIIILVHYYLSGNLIS